MWIYGFLAFLIGLLIIMLITSWVLQIRFLERLEGRARIDRATDELAARREAHDSARDASARDGAGPNATVSEGFVTRPGSLVRNKLQDKG